APRGRCCATSAAVPTMRLPPAPAHWPPHWVTERAVISFPPAGWASMMMSGYAAAAGSIRFGLLCRPGRRPGACLRARGGAPSRRLAAAAHDICGEALAAYALGGVSERGDFAQAERWYQQAAAAFAAVPSPRGVAESHFRLAGVHGL